jgi:hypothetical protein
MKDKAGNAASSGFLITTLTQQVTAVLETGADPDIKDNPETCLFAPVNKDTDIADLPTILPMQA